MISCPRNETAYIRHAFKNIIKKIHQFITYLYHGKLYFHYLFMQNNLVYSQREYNCASFFPLCTWMKSKTGVELKTFAGCLQHIKSISWFSLCFRQLESCYCQDQAYMIPWTICIWMQIPSVPFNDWLANDYLYVNNSWVCKSSCATVWMLSKDLAIIPPRLHYKIHHCSHDLLQCCQTFDSITNCLDVFLLLNACFIMQRYHLPHIANV